MKIIGAGLGRTGTKSLQAALTELGFGPCYHMTELIQNPAQVGGWRAASEGKPVDWASFLRDYQATVDFPGCSFYKELMVAFPDSKVLLSVRDPDRWYESCLETIYSVSHTWPMSWIGSYMPRMGKVSQLARRIVWEQMFEGRFLDRAFALARYKRHNEEVIRHVPPERLLVFDVKQGWEPLCKFLGVPVPDVPFPHLNDAAEFKRMIRKIRITQIGALAVAGAGSLLLLWKLVRLAKAAGCAKPAGEPPR